ncbi:MAG: non-canonical purine NTP diphosphatase [Fermentimonas sp.]|jgi:XTP/dITP diphosphohydrolase
MKKIVFATNNRNKLKEIRNIVGDKIEILSLSDINCHDTIEETGQTLEENAIIKAKYVKEKYGYDCFADDSGLEVEALRGAPGVYSSRYAGPDCDSEKNMTKLIKELNGVKNRAAQFRTIICLITDNETELFEGVIKGHITKSKSGNNGFGYDPIFIPEGYEKTFAEMDEEEKNNISHRAIATNKLISKLIELP